MFSALDVAKYIIDFINKANGKITNLKLQKLLYYVQLEFLKQNRIACFCDPIEAWRHGPVVRDVYLFYRGYSDRSIPNIFTPLLEFTETDQAIINEVINRFAVQDGWDLVRMTHKESPWKNTWNNGLGENNEITEEAICNFLNGE